MIERVIQGLRSSSTRTVLMHQAIADHVGLNATDMKCLDHLTSGPMTPGRLAALSALSTATITFVIDRLEAVGYVRREPDPADRRRVVLQLVGERLASEVFPLYESLARASREMLETYSDRDLAAILDFVTRSQTLVEDETRRLRASPALKPRMRKSVAAHQAEPSRK